MFLFYKLCPTALVDCSDMAKVTWSTAPHWGQFGGRTWWVWSICQSYGNKWQKVIPWWLNQYESPMLAAIWLSCEKTQRLPVKMWLGGFGTLRPWIKGRGWNVREIRWEGWLYTPRVLDREQKWIAQRARWRVSILQCYKIVGFSLKNSSTVDPICFLWFAFSNHLS